MEKQYYIKNLGCPNCAAKMEQAVGKIKGVKSATVSFVNTKLIIEYDNNASLEDILAIAEKKMKAIEDIELYPYEDFKAGKIGESNREHHHHDGEECDHEYHHHDGEECDHEHHHHDGEECDHEHHHHDGEECEHEHHHHDREECDHEHHHHQEIDQHHEHSNDHHSHEEGKENKWIEPTLMVVGILVVITAYILSKLSILPQTPALIMYIIGYVLVGYDVVFKSIKNILKGQVFDEFFLMSVATIGALCIGEYLESIAVMVFYKIGEYFQDKAVDSARHSIKSLVNIKPEFAHIFDANGELSTVKPEKVSVGDIIQIKPGERVPLDGVIIDGSTSLDVSAITGESKPLDATVGQEIYSGSINSTGLIKVKVSKAYGDSTVSRIMDMVENASDKKSHTEQFITKFARIYTPIVVFLAVAFAIVPPLISDSYTFMDCLSKALSFLVVSCPCALVISVPLGYFGGIGVASKNGILVKGGNFLEALANIDTVVFDKTGTLTYGAFVVTKVSPVDMTEEQLLDYAAYAEYKTNHPIAHSILDKANVVIDEAAISTFTEIAGHGISAVVNIDNAQHEVLAGNHRLMDKYEIGYEEVDSAATIIYVAVDGKFAGSIVISDQIKDGCKESLEELKKLGVKNTVLLSGDNKKIIDEVAKELDITMAIGECLPDDKLNKVEEIYKENPEVKLVYVGDGINDAPVLARADVGVAMGMAGQDAAIEAADVVLITDELGKLAEAIKISRFTRQVVMENILFALVIKVVVLLLIIVGMSMWLAVFADVGVALLAVLNSIRVYKKKF